MDVTESDVLRLVRGRRYRPMTADDMAKHFKVPKSERAAFDELIAELKRTGEIVEVKNRCLADPDKVDLIVGKLLCNPRGFGFIRPAREKDGEDVYVHGSNMSSAMQGDIVAARFPKPKKRRGGRSRRQKDSPEVKIVSVVERARTHIVGTFVTVRNLNYVVPDDPRQFRDIFVAPQDAHGATHEDKVNVRVLTWPSRHINPTGEVVEVFGPRGQLEAERQSVIAGFDLRNEWPDEVKRAADRVRDRVTKSECRDREDFEGEMVVTIDPTDARDFDDAVSVRRVKKGGWELEVHIADVSHYVRDDDPIDREALERSTSVYLPGQVIPMLPEKLSNNICSLRPDVRRLTKTVRMRFDRRGTMQEFDCFRSVIRSARRFTYQEVQKVIEGGRLKKKEEPFRKKLLEMNELAELLRARRKAEGMIELEIPEPRILTDEHGRTTGIELRHNDASHRLIEQFMLAANEAVANYLIEHDLPYLARVHDEPDPDAIRDYREDAQALGVQVPSPGTKEQLIRFLDRISGRPEAPILHFLLLRSMQMAEYAAEDRPHYAIGVEHYLHFTSPIRRYPDLLAHRILDEYWDGLLDDAERAGAWREALPGLMAHCTGKERNAESAERAIVLRRMKEYLGGLTHPLDAMIIAAESYGLRVQLRDSLVEGVVRMSSLTDGFYRVDRRRRALVGPKNRTYKVGDTIKVRVKDFDELKYQIEFQPVR